MLLRVRRSAVVFACSLFPLAGMAEEQQLGFQVDVSAIFMTREAPSDQTILTRFGFQPTDLVNASSIEPGYEPGFKIRLHADVTKYIGVEASGTFLSTFSDSFSTPNGLIQAVVPAIAFGATSIQTEWESEFSAQQVNVTYDVIDGVSAFAGVRRFAIDETLSMRFQNAPNVTIDQQVNNNLIGPQIGARINARPLIGDVLGPFDIGLELAGGVLFNSISASSTGSGGAFASQTDGTETGYFAQAGVSAGVALEENFILSLGYQALWISDVLQVTEQFGTTNVLGPGTTLARTDDLLYHGGQLKLTYIID